MEKEVEDRRIELDIAQRRRERESGTKKRKHKKSTANCRQFLFRKGSQLLPFWTFYWTFPPCLCPFKSSPRNLFWTCSNFGSPHISAHLRTLVYESSSLWCESWELSDALCDLRRSSLLMALRELGYWQGAKWQHKILPNFYIILSYPQNSWLMAAWRYPVDRKSWEIWGIWQAAPQGSLTTKLPWTRLAHLPVLTDQNDVLVECII